MNLGEYLDNEPDDGPVQNFYRFLTQAGKREQDTRPAPRTFPAKYASRCFQCDQQIDEGDIVAWLPGERATHENCWDDQ